MVSPENIQVTLYGVNMLCLGIYRGVYVPVYIYTASITWLKKDEWGGAGRGLEEGKEEKTIIKTISKVSSNKKINVISGHCRHVARVPFVPYPLEWMLPLFTSICIRTFLLRIYYCPLHWLWLGPYHNVHVLIYLDHNTRSHRDLP